MANQDPPTYQCPIYESTGPRRNLIVCIDGTSNKFGTTNTNIVELYSQITKNDRQLTYYSSGLGTVAKFASQQSSFSNKLDMAFGWNLHKVIMDAYRWLSDNYRDGDCIFLFGFSRGAYQVRALAGMISRVGLLLPGNNEQIPFAFELYSNTEDDDPSLEQPASVLTQPAKASKKQQQSTELAETFQKTFCRSNVHIHFVGVWDTVSSVGAFGRSKTLPCTTTSCKHICYFRHALALDERRVKFLPEYAYGGRSNSNKDGRVKEVWFAGCHSDVGGGNRFNERHQSGDVPLLWMRSQAVAAGLEMEPGNVMWKIDDLNKHIKDSLHPIWWPLELLPLKRLLYYNSNRHTSRPHVGGPRRILLGQKVHVSALFKSNYKPYAQFYNIPERWPEPMFWNDVASQERLQNLSDLWEKDIFDDQSVKTLLDDLKRPQPNLDTLDRLAFMSSFEFCKSAITSDAKAILDPFLNRSDVLIRLSTVVIYCELGWDWPTDIHDKLVEKITADVSELLKGSERRRACMYIPSLCRKRELRTGLVSDGNLKMLVESCDDTRVNKHQEETFTVAFYSAQALSVLIKLDANLPQRLVNIQAVSDIQEALHSKCNPALVSILGVMDGLAKHEMARSTLRDGPTVPSLLRLVKRYDDFVAPMAIRVLCSCLPDDQLRSSMVDFGMVNTLLDMLDQCSEETRQVACQALVEFATYAEAQRELTEAHLRKLANRVLSQDPAQCDGPILALVALGNTGNTEVKGAVMGAIKAEKTICLLVARLNHKSVAFSAASALARLVKIEGVAFMVTKNNSASRNIIHMLERRWFDGLRGEDGLSVLSDLFACERLRTRVLKRGALTALGDMINREEYEETHAGLHYLRAIAQFGEHRNALSSPDALKLIPRVINAFRVPHRRVQRIAMEILYLFSAQEDLRDAIVQGLLSLLRERRHACVILATSTMLGFLSKYKSIRGKVLTDETFRKLTHEFYGGQLEYAEGSGPRRAEVYDAVGQMIQLMQMHEHDESTGGRHYPMLDEKRWFMRVPYELKKGHQPNSSWPTTLLLLFCPLLLLCGAGQQTYRELWEEG